MMDHQTRWRSIGSVLAVIVLLAIVAPFAVYAVPQLVGAEESFVVLSGSMEPTLSAGDVVIVDADATVEVGDVVTYSSGSEAVTTTHRVVDATETGFVTKGDANENADPGLLLRDSIIGEVVLVIPLIGQVILWSNTPVGLVVLVVIPVTALVLTELREWTVQRDPPNTDDTTSEGVTDGSVREMGTDGTTRKFGHGDGEKVLDWAVPDGQLDRSNGGITVGMTDLKMTLISMGVLFAYAAWNIVREITAVSVPHPVSVGVLTGSLLGLVLAGWITISTWRIHRRENITAGESLATRTDGSGTMEEIDE